MEGDAQEAPLTSAGYQTRDVEEGRSQQLAVRHDPHASALLHHEEPRITRRRRQVEGSIEASSHDLHSQSRFIDVAGVLRHVRLRCVGGTVAG